MDELKEKYYNYKNSVDNNYAGGLISEITDYVDALEKKIAELENNYYIKCTAKTT
jgi:glycine cleavage system regulatory protein